MYVLIVMTFVHGGIITSQQEYRGLSACETAAAAITEMASDMGRGNFVKTRCVLKSGEHQ